MSMFKLPEEFDKFRVAITIPIMDDLSFRCRWATNRDASWSATFSEKLSKGDYSFNIAYYAAILSATLEGMNGKRIIDFIDEAETEIDPALYKLLLKESNELTDNEFSEVCTLKFKEIVNKLPPELTRKAYSKHYGPWLKNNELNLNLSEIDRFDEDLEDLPDSENEQEKD